MGSSSIHPPVECVLGGSLYLGKRQPDPEAGHSSLFTAEIKSVTVVMSDSTLKL